MNHYASLFDLSGRTALVVGAGSGIGQASALALAAFGAHVVCADIVVDAAQSTAAAIADANGSAIAATVDLRDRGQIGELVASLPALDILVSTPSINVRKPMLELTEEDFDRVIGLNLRGTFSLLRAGGRRMAAAGRGSIIVFSSIRSQVIEPGQSIYAATKAGTVQLVRTLAAELGSSGVRANAIAPGVVDTPLTAPIKQKPDWYQAYADKSILKRWARADEMAGAVVFLA